MAWGFNRTLSEKLMVPAGIQCCDLVPTPCSGPCCEAIFVPMLVQVAHVAVEMAPIAKVGGMGDVVTALGRAVQEEGHSVEVRTSLAAGV